MAIISGIHHIALKCCGAQEYEEAIHFYRDVLELPVVRSWATGTMLNTGSGLMEIFSDGTERLEQGAIRHFAFAVENTDACIEAVRKAGYKVTMEPKDIVIPSSPACPARIGFCIGPVGEEIEFFHER